MKDKIQLLEEIRGEFAAETDERKRRRIAFDLIALIPPDQAADLIPLLDDKDLWVQERAAEILGKLRYQPAISKLVEVAARETTRVPNARIAALIALGKMKWPASFEHLIKLSQKIPAPFHPYIYKALEHNGYPIKIENGRWLYQHDGEWSSL